jgi:hypothetical protein
MSFHAQTFSLTEHKDATPTRKGAESDHTAVILKIHINKLAFKMKDKKLTTKTDWEKILNAETTNAIYNKNYKK